MSKTKNVVQPDEHFDEGLCKVMGECYKGEEAPPSEEFTRVKKACQNLMDAVKMPALFGALIVFIAWAANTGLMDPVIAIPGMCVCSGCAGYQLHK